MPTSLVTQITKLKSRSLNSRSPNSRSPKSRSPKSRSPKSRSRAERTQHPSPHPVDSSPEPDDPALSVSRPALSRDRPPAAGVRWPADPDGRRRRTAVPVRPARRRPPAQGVVGPLTRPSPHPRSVQNRRPPAVQSRISLSRSLDVWQVLGSGAGKKLGAAGHRSALSPVV